MGTNETLGVIAFETCARRDVRWWALLLVGLAFAYGGFTIDPLANCSEDGECAPWLVPVAAVMGVVAAMGGLAQLLVNARRGSRFDLKANRLEWWQNRTASSPGDSGSVALDQIGRILINRRSEDAEISLYDLSGQRLHHFDSEVIGWSIDCWVERVQAAMPTIALEVRD